MEIYLVLTIRGGKKIFPPVEIISVPPGVVNFRSPDESKFYTIRGGNFFPPVEIIPVPPGVVNFVPPGGSKFSTIRGDKKFFQRWK